MVTPMLRPDLFGGLATHAGDALFELCYLPDFRDAARALRDGYDGSFEKFWADFRSRPAFTKGTDFPLLNTWAMAACYSANDDGTVELPFEPSSGKLRPDVWERWLAWDPVRMAEHHADALRGLRAVYIDAGKRDQFFLDLGAEAFRAALAAIGVTDVFFELFDATHSSIEYRYPLALRYLAERLSLARRPDEGRVARARDLAAGDAGLDLREHVAAVLGGRRPRVARPRRQPRHRFDRPLVGAARGERGARHLDEGAPDPAQAAEAPGRLELRPAEPEGVDLPRSSGGVVDAAGGAQAAHR